MTDHLDETRGARIDRRAFLKVGLALPILGAPRAHQIGSQVNWFTLLIKVQVDLPEGGAGSVWLPMAIDRATPYQRTLDQRWTANSKTIDAIRDQRSGLSVLHASWRGGEGPRSLTLTMKIATRDHAVSMEEPAAPLASIPKWSDRCG